MNNKNDINGLRVLASDILYAANILTYYTVKKEFEHTND